MRCIAWVVLLQPHLAGPACSLSALKPGHMLSVSLTCAFAGPLGASDDLPVQPPAPPGHHQGNPTIDLKDVARLSQHTGVLDSRKEGMSMDYPSGFTIPIPRSDDSQGTNRSSIDFRCACLSNIANSRMHCVL